MISFSLQESDLQDGYGVLYPIFKLQIGLEMDKLALAIWFFWCYYRDAQIMYSKMMLGPSSNWYIAIFAFPHLSQKLGNGRTLRSGCSSCRTVSPCNTHACQVVMQLCLQIIKLPLLFFNQPCKCSPRSRLADV